MKVAELFEKYGIPQFSDEAGKAFNSLPGSDREELAEKTVKIIFFKFDEIPDQFKEYGCAILIMDGFYLHFSERQGFTIITDNEAQTGFQKAFADTMGGKVTKIHLN